MSKIVKGKGGYSIGLAKLSPHDDYVPFSWGGEDYVAFRTTKSYFYGNVSHGTTHKIEIDGNEVWAHGFRWYSSMPLSNGRFGISDERVKAAMNNPCICEKVMNLPIIEVAEDIDCWQLR